MFEDKRLLTIIVDAIFRTYSYDWSKIYVNENGANGLRAWLNTRNASGRKCAALKQQSANLGQLRNWKALPMLKLSEPFNN